MSNASIFVGFPPPSGSAGGWFDDDYCTEDGNMMPSVVRLVADTSKTGIPIIRLDIMQAHFQGFLDFKISSEDNVEVSAIPHRCDVNGFVILVQWGFKGVGGVIQKSEGLFDDYEGGISVSPREHCCGPPCREGCYVSILDPFRENDLRLLAWLEQSQSIPITLRYRPTDWDKDGISTKWGIESGLAHREFFEFHDYAPDENIVKHTLSLTGVSRDISTAKFASKVREDLKNIPKPKKWREPWIDNGHIGHQAAMSYFDKAAASAFLEYASSHGKNYGRADI